MSNAVRTVIRGGLVVDRHGYRAEDISIVDGVVAAVSSDIEPDVADIEIDARGKLVMPAFVDPHTHLRIPGGEEAETLASGTRAAALGGYAAVFAMPNTEPALDNPVRISQLLGAAAALPVKVLCAASITRDRAGIELAPFYGLHQVGVRVVTDDGSGLQDAHLMRRALEYCSELGMVVAQHAEVEALFRKGVMNEGQLSARLGVSGIPASAEEVMVARDIELARAAGARIHFLHLSTARSADLVARAKADGVAVSAEVTPHHLTMTEDLLGGYDSRFKVNPPLRAREDVDGLWEHLGLGTFDVIGTDHAPHPMWKKNAPLDQAAFGMLGLQHSIAALWSEIPQVIARGRARVVIPEAIRGTIGALGSHKFNPEELAWLWQLLSMMSWKPAELIGLRSGFEGELVPGRTANVVVFDPFASREVMPASIVSKASNSPYLGRVLRGQVVDLFVEGRWLVAGGSLIEEGNWI